MLWTSALDPQISALRRADPRLPRIAADSPYDYVLHCLRFTPASLPGDMLRVEHAQLHDARLNYLCLCHIIIVIDCTANARKGNAKQTTSLPLLFRAVARLVRLERVAATLKRVAATLQG